MTYQTVPTVTTGEMWTASQHNTYVRDNFASLWPYTGQGSIAYADSTTTLASPASVTGIKILQSVSGVPTWSAPPSRKFCYVTRTNQTANIGITGISFSTEIFDNNSMWSSGSPTSISLPDAGIYRFDGCAVWNSNDAGRRAVILYDGASKYMDSRMAIDGLYTSQSFSYVYYTSSSKTVTIRVEQASLDSLKVDCYLMVTYLGAV